MVVIVYTIEGQCHAKYPPCCSAQRKLSWPDHRASLPPVCSRDSSMQLFRAENRKIKRPFLPPARAHPVAHPAPPEATSQPFSRPRGPRGRLAGGLPSSPADGGSVQLRGTSRGDMGERRETLVGSREKWL